MTRNVRGLGNSHSQRSVLSELISRLSAALIKISQLLVGADRRMLTDTRERPHIWNSQDNLERKTTLEANTSAFKTFYKAVVLNTARGWCKDRQTDQCDRTEARKRPMVMGFQERCRGTSMGKDSYFRTWSWVTQMPTLGGRSRRRSRRREEGDREKERKRENERKENLDPYFISTQKST